MDHPQYVIKVDDRDPSIYYSNNTWSLGGNNNEYLGTTTRTNKTGAFVRIPFTGTMIVIFGTIDSAASGKSPVSTFNIDNGHAQEILQKQTDVVQYQQKIYESPEVPPGPHVLVITILSVPSVKAFFSFDWAECHTSDPILSYRSPAVISTADTTEQFKPLHPASLDTYSKQGVQMVIRLDDRDSTISYSADTWSFGGNDSEYLATTTRTSRPGAFMKIPFTGAEDYSYIYTFTLPGNIEGTKIMVFGTIDSVDSGKSPMALFSLDGGRSKMSSQAQTGTVHYQQKLYESPDLEPEPHVLVVTITSVPSAMAPFTFDYADYYPCDIGFLSSPLVATVAMMGQAPFDSHQALELKSDIHSKPSGQPIFKIDNRDPAISYSINTWSLGGNGNEYLGTTTRTHLAGASMRIPFLGTKIMIYGTIDSAEMGESPVSLFIIDGGLHAEEFIQKQNDEFQWQRKFYESPNLPPGPHVLEVIITSAPSTRAHFTFDYAQYFPFDSPPVSSSLSPSASMSSQDTIMNERDTLGTAKPCISETAKQSTSISEMEDSINTEMAAMAIDERDSTRTRGLFPGDAGIDQDLQSSGSESFSTLHTSTSALSVPSTAEEWWLISEASGSGPMITTAVPDSETTTGFRAATSTTPSKLFPPQDTIDQQVSPESSVSTVKANNPRLAKPVSRIRGFLFKG